MLHINNTNDALESVDLEAHSINTPISTNSLINSLAREELIPSALAEEQLAALTDSLLGIYRRGFLRENENSPEQLEDAYNDLYKHLAAAERITLLSSSEGYLGFVCASLHDTELGKVYYLDGVVLDPDIQGAGVAQEVLAQELQVTDAELFAFHTQSRRMLALGFKLADISEEVSMAIAESFEHEDIDRVVDHGRYGDRALYGDKEKLKEIAVPGLKVDHGDALFAAGFVLGR